MTYIQLSESEVIKNEILEALKDVIDSQKQFIYKFASDAAEQACKEINDYKNKPVIIKYVVEACVNAFGKGLVKGINLTNMFNPKLEELENG